jgi:threonine dehydrogenase-like Zn-dependent dehydrogenase
MRESTGGDVTLHPPVMTNAVPAHMRALVLDGTGFEHLRVVQVPTPRPGPRQLLARVDCAGICTSLVKLIEQGPAHELLYGWDPAKWPLILGDEGSVTIVEAGRDLRGAYAPGERYVVQPAVDHAPVNNRERYRDSGRGVAKVAVSYTLPGQLAEYVLVTEEVIEAGCLLPVIDPELPYAHAAAAEPISCVISAQAHHLHLVQETPRSERAVHTGILAGGVTLIVGSGVMGRMHVDLALASRPRALFVTDPLEERLARVRSLFSARAERFGVELVTADARADVPGLVAALTDRRGADDVVVAVGSRDAIAAAQELVGRGGVLNLFGGLKRSEAIVPLDTTAVHYRELVVTGSSGGSPWDVARALELMAAGDIDAGLHVTRVGDLEHAPELIALVKEQKLDGKAVVYPHRRLDEMLAVDSWTAADERRHLDAALV